VAVVEGNTRITLITLYISVVRQAVSVTDCQSS